MSSRIVVVGSLNMDLVVRVPHIPRPGETVIASSDMQRFPGGKGANQACAAARLGASVGMVGRVGEDDFGAALIESIAGAGVDTRHVLRDPAAPTGVGLIAVDEKGQNSIVVSSGANARVGEADLAAAGDLIEGAGLLVLQLEIPLTTVIAAARWAREHGVRTILNPAPARELPAELLALIDILIPNETEAAMLSGRNVGTDDEIHEAASSLRRMGVPTVIITRGSAGCSLVTQAGVSHHPAFSIDPVDTTAAGDAFIGGFAAALARARPLHEAVRHGNAAGAIASSRPGAQPSLPDRQQLEALAGGVSET